MTLLSLNVLLILDFILCHLIINLSKLLEVTKVCSLCLGINQEYMLKQQKRYEEFKTEAIAEGRKQPLGEGALIFDEVKIIDKLIWNSKSERFVGVAMSSEEFPQICDLFPKQHEQTSEPQAAQYVLQFLWRDLSANFDVIGPYFSSDRHLTQSFMMSCLMETMRVLHACGFQVTCLVCDGASTNLSLIKTTMGLRGLHYVAFIV
jgi:hypothetical protein